MRHPGVAELQHLAHVPAASRSVAQCRTCIRLCEVLQSRHRGGVCQRRRDGAGARAPRPPQRKPHHSLVVAHQPGSRRQAVELRGLPRGVGLQGGCGERLEREVPRAAICAVNRGGKRLGLGHCAHAGGSTPGGGSGCVLSVRARIRSTIDALTAALLPHRCGTRPAAAAGRGSGCSSPTVGGCQGGGAGGAGTTVATQSVRRERAGAGGRAGASRRPLHPFPRAPCSHTLNPR